jgi:hypothetical protein
MTAQSAANLLLIVTAIAWILGRQVQVAPVKPRLLLLAPVVMGYFGIRDLPPSLWRSTVDVVPLLVSAAVSAGLGIWRGRTIAVWQDVHGAWWRRGSTLTLLLWAALFAVRGLLYVVDLATGHPEASGLGVLLCTLAITFAAQNSVIALRVTAPAPRPGERLLAGG